MEGVEISWFGVVVATFVAFFLGVLWYGPLFGRAWVSATGFEPTQSKQGNLSLLVGGSFALEFIMAFCLAMFLGNALSPAQGALYGFLAGFGWVGLAMVLHALYDQRPFRLGLINLAYWTLAFTLMGLVIAFFQASPTV